MEAGLKRFRFGHIISHTFPGILLGVQLIIFLDLLTPHRICFFILQYLGNFSGFITIAGFFLVLATILGLIIDALQHLIFECVIERLHTYKTGETYEIYQIHRVKSEMAIRIFHEIFEDQLWYYYEAYANIALCLLPIYFLIPRISKILRIGSPWPLVAYLSTSVIIGILCIEAFITYKQAKKTEKELVQTHLDS